MWIMSISSKILCQTLLGTVDNFVEKWISIVKRLFKKTFDKNGFFSYYYIQIIFVKDIEGNKPQGAAEESRWGCESVLALCQ